MKTNSNLFSKLGGTALLALIASASLATNTNASEIQMRVNAYGRQWALVVVGSNTGGRVIWSSVYGSYITDRAARGEAIVVDFKATHSDERATDCGGYSTCYSRNFGPVPLPFQRSGFVSTDPACDNQYYWITSNYAPTTVRLPIGGRP